MVRVPGSGDEWAEHVHTTGRKFLSNVRTSETKWVWTKWDMNGRHFVRNTINPIQRVWVDEMNLSMRIESGNATPHEVEQYVNSHHPPNPSTSTSIASNPTANSATVAAAINPTTFRSAHPEPRQYQHQFNVAKQLSQAQPSQHGSHLHSPTYIRGNLLPPQARIKKTEKRGRSTRFGADRTAVASTETFNLNHRRDTSDSNFNGAPYSMSQTMPVGSNGVFLSTQEKGVSNDTHNVYKPPVPQQLPSSVVSRYVSPRRQHLDPGHQNTISLLPLSKDANISLAAKKLVVSLPSSSLYKADKTLSIAYKHRVHGSSGSSRAASASESNGLDACLYEPIVGTCDRLEKDFLRLTSAPKPEAVRPPHVLRLALANVKSKWGDGLQGYDWVCRQLKSIRQDYTVQALTDCHVVDVYKTHARIALENGDLGEFNTCVAQLQQLFAKVDVPTEERDEFAAYRILYSVIITSTKAWEVQKVFAKLSIDQRRWPAVQFAWQICLSVTRGDYHHYFRLATCPPKHTMAHFLLAYIDRRVRHRALRAMVAAYGPGQPGLIPFCFVATELGWRLRNSEQRDASEALRVLPRTVLGSDDNVFFEKFRRLGLIREPAWVFHCAKFLLSINIVLHADESIAASASNSTRANAIFIDCKRTKAGGVGDLKENSKLITHAGAAFRRQ